MNYSVVIPAYNAEHTLEKTLKSIAQQTLPVAEVILVNDGSTDATLAIAKRWQKKLPLQIVDHRENNGLTQSLVDGVNATKNSWILRIDADDIWAPNHVKIIDHLRQSSNAILISTQARFVNMAGVELMRTLPIKPNRVRAELMFSNKIIHSASAFSRADYQKVGGYRLMTKWEDYDLWIRLLTEGDYCTTNEVTVSYLVRPNSVSRVALPSETRFGNIQCNKLAIKCFWKRHPVQALRCSLGVAVNYMWLLGEQLTLVLNNHKRL